jgi:hypothetical protein
LALLSFRAFWVWPILAVGIWQFWHFEGDFDGILEIFGEMSNFALR